MFQYKNAASKSPNSPHVCQHVVLFHSTDDEYSLFRVICGV